MREKRICGVPLSCPSDTPEREGRGDQPDPELVVGDAAMERRLDRLHLGGDAEIALAVAQVADDGPDRIVDLLDVLTQEPGRADPLHVAPGVERDERACFDVLRRRHMGEQHMRCPGTSYPMGGVRRSRARAVATSWATARSGGRA